MLRLREDVLLFFLIMHFTFLQQVPYSMIIIHFNLCVTKSDMQRTEQVVILSINKIINPKSSFFCKSFHPIILFHLPGGVGGRPFSGLRA